MVGWVGPTPSRSNPVDAFADKDIDGNAAILRLAFFGAVIRDWIGFSHTGRRQHAIRSPAAFLLQMVDDTVRTALTEHLVIVFAAD